MLHPLDRENMEAVIRRSPEQFSAGLAAAASVPLPRGPFARVLVAGMGGSWMGAQLMADAGLACVPITVHRDYGLPLVERSGTLVIVSSFSGNTEETLSAFEQARTHGIPVIGIAGGGELEKRCAADGVSFVNIPADPPTMQPRSATGYSVGIVTQLLQRLGMTTPGAADAIAALGTFLARRMDQARAHGERLASKLTEVTPVVYASAAFGIVARIWKIKINENAKTPAFWNVFPELNHNEMIGWSKIGRSLGEGRTNPHGRFHVLVLRSPDDHPRVQKRMDSTLELLRAGGIPGTLVPIEGQTRTEQIFDTLLVGDWLSYHLALALGTDPSPVDMVEDLKRRLKEPTQAVGNGRGTPGEPLRTAKQSDGDPSPTDSRSES